MSLKNDINNISSIMLEMSLKNVKEEETYWISPGSINTSMINPHTILNGKHSSTGALYSFGELPNHITEQKFI